MLTQMESANFEAGQICNHCYTVDTQSLSIALLLVQCRVSTLGTVSQNVSIYLQLHLHGTISGSVVCELTLQAVQAVHHTYGHCTTHCSS